MRKLSGIVDSILSLRKNVLYRDGIFSIAKNRIRQTLGNNPNQTTMGQNPVFADGAYHLGLFVCSYFTVTLTQTNYCNSFKHLVSTILHRRN